MSDFQEEIARHHMKSMVSSPDIYKNLVDQMRQDGAISGDWVSHQEMESFVKDDSRWEIKTSQEAVLRIQLEAWGPVADVLMDRRWSLLLFEQDSPCLVCSDFPVSISRLSSKAPGFLGFGTPYTMVAMPIDRSMALVGAWSGPENVVRLSNREISSFLNQRTVDCAREYVFSATEKFDLLGGSGEQLRWLDEEL